MVALAPIVAPRLTSVGRNSFLREIAERVRRMTAHLGAALVALGYKIGQEPFFDTLRITTLGKWSAHELLQEAVSRGINLRLIDADTVSVSLDETATEADLDKVVAATQRAQPAIAVLVRVVGQRARATCA